MLMGVIVSAGTNVSEQCEIADSMGYHIGSHQMLGLIRGTYHI